MAKKQAFNASDKADALTQAGAHRKKPSYIVNAAIIIVASLCLISLYLLTQNNLYLLFHGIIETSCITIAFAIFAIAWNSRHIMDNKFFLFIGIAFLFIAGLDLLHMLAYKGMGVFPNELGANLATQLWVATRYVFAFSLLIPLLLVKRKTKSSIIAVSYTIVTASLVLSIFWWQNFPIAYVEGMGLTAFKIVSEYAIAAILLVSIGLLFKKRQEFSPDVFRLLLLGMGTAVATEMAFTFYVDIYGIANVVGHLLDVVSFYFIYRALVETGLNKPYELLFRNLKQSETALANRAKELSKLNEKLEGEIVERSAMQEALKDSQEQLQLKLDSVLSPDIELSEEDLANIIDVPRLQATMNYLYTVTKMGFALINLNGKVLVGTGWQDICTKFHRVNPTTCKNCIESDVELTSGLQKGEVRLYKCKNNMWDVVTPLFIGDKHVGNVFFGQFFFDDEKVDRELFAAQAEKYGFNKEEYLDAFNHIPRFSREKIQNLMVFYSRLSEIISKISHANVKLAKALAQQKELQLKLEEKAAEVEEYASQMEGLAEDRAKQLKNAERMAAIGQTAGMVGHDIRNPLQAIVGDLYLGKLEVESLPQSEAKQNLLDSIHSIEENIVYINKIVADLQDFARPLIPKKEQVDVEKAIKETTTMVAIPANIKLAVETDEKLPLLTADSTMIKRILVNLTQNAVQAMPNGGNLTISAKEKRHHVEIAIEDTGEGIPKEVQAKLFTPLMTTKSKGQGFGLAVVKRMTEAMDGAVIFESKQGKGTKFTLKFPI